MNQWVYNNGKLKQILVKAKKTWVLNSVFSINCVKSKVFPHQVNKRENSKRRVFGLLLCLKRVVTQIAKTYYFGINTKLKY